MVHHATMAYDIDAIKMNEVLRIGMEKIRDKGTCSAAGRVDPMYPRPAFRGNPPGVLRPLQGEVNATGRQFITDEDLGGRTRLLRDEVRSRGGVHCIP